MLGWDTDTEILEAMIARGALLEAEKAEPFFHKSSRTVPPDAGEERNLWVYREVDSGLEIPLMPTNLPEVEIEGPVTTLKALDAFGPFLASYEKYFSDTEALEREMLYGIADPGDYDVQPPPYFGDLEAQLTPWTWQGTRRTCTALASAALLELIYNQSEGLAIDLSEQNMHFDFYERTYRPHTCDCGFPVGLAPLILADQPLRLESYWKYRESWDWVQSAISAQEYSPPVLAKLESSFVAHGGTLLEAQDIRGARNYRLLESLLCEGHGVVIELDFGAVRSEGCFKPAQTVRGSHTVLLWGYDSNQRQFFAKDSAVGPKTCYSYETIGLRAMAAFVFESVEQVA